VSPFTAWPLSFWAPGAESQAGCSPLRLQSPPFTPTPQGPLCLCRPLAAPAVAFAHAKYSFWKDLFSLIGWPPSSLPCTVREGKAMGGKVDRLTTQAKSLWDYCVSSAYGNPGPRVQFCTPPFLLKSVPKITPAVMTRASLFIHSGNENAQPLLEDLESLSVLGPLAGALRRALEDWSQPGRYLVQVSRLLTH